MAKVLPQSFFRRPALVVASELLGKFLVRQQAGGNVARMITEVEAYIGPHDLASHSSRGRTARNEAMFLPGGAWYVYFVYGMHWMLNIVTDGRDYPSAILIRGVDGVTGPGRVAKFFAVDKQLYGKQATKKTGLYIEDWGIVVPTKNLIRSARIGVDYAGPIWSQKKYNYKLKIRN